MRKLILFFILVINVNAQNRIFPSEFVGFYAKPQGNFVGNVRTVLVASYRNGKLLGDIIVETYDSNHRKIEELTHHAEIEEHSNKIINLSHKVLYFYKDLEKNPMSSSVFENDGRKGNSIFFKYDTNGRLIEELVYEKDNSLHINSKYIYDDKKKEISIFDTRYFGERSIIQKLILEQNDKLQIQKRISYDKEGKIKDETFYEYNKDGLIAKLNFCCKTNFTYTYEYKFDEQGNWIERVEYYLQKDKLGNKISSESMRTYRIITYFDNFLEMKNSLAEIMQK